MASKFSRFAWAAAIFAAGVIAADLGPKFFGSPKKAEAPAATSPLKPTSQAKVDLPMDAERIELAQIEVAKAVSGIVAKRLLVPGVIVPDGDRVARVAVKLAGTVSELRKNIGDEVSKGEILGAIESREVAEARSEYLASKLSDNLQQELTGRDKGLSEGRAIPEQQYIKSRSAAAQSRMRADLARQKLLALGLEEREIAGIAAAPEDTLRRQYVRAPIAGRIVERKVEIGAAVGRDSQSTEMFGIIDLAKVWVEMTVGSGDLSDVREGQTVRITVPDNRIAGIAKIIFVNPLLDKQTRAARVVAVLDNEERSWRPGAFVTAAIALSEKKAIVVPVGAIQIVFGKKAVFVRTSDGFQKRDVVLGQRDGDVTEIVAGLTAGESVASTNTFALKAELAKPTDED